MTPLIGLLVILQTNPVEPAAWSPHEFDSVEAACSVLWEMGAVEPKEEERPTLFVEEDERPDDAVVIDLDEIWNSYDRSWQTRVMGERDRPKVWPLSYRPLPEDRIAALHSLSEESVPIWTQIVRGSRSQRFFFSPPWQDLAFRLDGLARALGWIRAREALAERDADGVAESSRVVFDWATRLMVFPAWGWIMYMGSTPLDTRVEARRMRVLAVPHLPAPPQWTTSPTSDEDTLREFYGHRILSDAGTGSSLAKAMLDLEPQTEAESAKKKAMRRALLGMARNVEIALRGLGGDHPWPELSRLLARSTPEARDIDRDRDAVLVSLIRPVLPEHPAYLLEQYRRELALLRLERVALAISHYRHDHGGELPATLDEVVGAHLDIVPRDPFAGYGTLRYRRTPDANSAILYSVGPDGVDDRGHQSSSGAPDLDRDFCVVKWGVSPGGTVSRCLVVPSHCVPRGP